MDQLTFFWSFRIAIEEGAQLTNCLRGGQITVYVDCWYNHNAFNKIVSQANLTSLVGLAEVSPTNAYSVQGLNVFGIIIFMSMF